MAKQPVKATNTSLPETDDVAMSQPRQPASLPAPFLKSKPMESPNLSTARFLDHSSSFDTPTFQDRPGATPDYLDRLTPLKRKASFNLPEDSRKSSPRRDNGLTSRPSSPIQPAGKTLSQSSPITTDDDLVPSRKRQRHDAATGIQLDNLKDRVDNLSKKVDDAEERLAKTEWEIDQVYRRLDVVELQLAQFEMRLTQVEEQHTEVEERLTRIEGRLTQVEMTTQLAQAADEKAMEALGLIGKILDFMES
ncbi:hypothetical protein BKA56DRAFT_728706 [Ilyonectria sp. MPI-CAGE-AT-0026]|nr:hypothetical protein BKA56DRAFT_728706 [Ilyonectria sp. MPI-CAGE-AT-0026]